MFSSILHLIKEYKKDLFVLLFFIAISSVSVLYSLSLPYIVNGDTYIVLLATKTEADINYPDRDILQKMDFRPYLYPDILEFFTERFSLQATTYILLFILVFCTGFSAYLALRMLDFSRTVSVAVSLVALFPRASIGSEIWGVFTYGEVLGRSFGLPVLWLLTAWFIKRKYENKSLWPVFAVAGLTTYIHPVSIIFFSGILFLIQFYYLVTEKNYRQRLKDFALSIFAFSVSASFLLMKIVGSTSQIATGNSGAVSVSGQEYAESVFSRNRWDFPPASTLWLRNILVVSFIFLLAITWAYFKIYKKGGNDYGENTGLYREIFRFCIPLIIFSAFISIAFPALQMWLMREHDWPLIFQQGSRIFKYYYLAIFLMTAVSLSLFLQQHKIKKIALVLIVIVGILSSSLGLEWFEFIVGYKNYSEGVIPAFLQKKNYTDDSLIYPQICNEMKIAGIQKNNLVLSGDFPLRYFCETKLLVTLEEGMSYMMSGKNEMVWWYRTYREQAAAFNGNAENLIQFAKKEKADYALLSSGTPLVKEFNDLKMVVSSGEKYSIIKFK